MTDTEKNSILEEIRKISFDAAVEAAKGNREAADKALADLDAKTAAANKAIAGVEREVADLKTAIVNGAGATVKNAAEVKSFFDYARTGAMNSMTTVASEGGVMVPTPQVEEIVRLIGNGNPMRELATTITIGGESYKYAVRATVGSAAYGVETGAPGTSGAVISRSNTATPTFTSGVITPVEFYSWQPVTQQLLSDADFDVEAEITAAVADQFGALENEAFFNGSGGAGAVQGIIGGVSTVADASWSAGSVGYIAGGSASTIANADKVFELQAALDDRYQENATWLMNKATYNTLRTMKVGANTANAYLLWQPEFIGGRIAMTLAGAPVRRCSGMPDIGANAYPVAYGDFRQAYRIVDRTGMVLLRDPYTQNPFVVFKFTKRTGGGVRNTQAYKLLKVAVS